MLMEEFVLNWRSLRDTSVRCLCKPGCIWKNVLLCSENHFSNNTTSAIHLNKLYQVMIKINKYLIVQDSLAHGCKTTPREELLLSRKYTNSSSTDSSIMNEIILPTNTQETVIVHTHNEHRQPSSRTERRLDEERRETWRDKQWQTVWEKNRWETRLDEKRWERKWDEMRRDKRERDKGQDDKKIKHDEAKETTW